MKFRQEIFEFNLSYDKRTLVSNIEIIGGEKESVKEDICKIIALQKYDKILYEKAMKFINGFDIGKISNAIQKIEKKLSGIEISFYSKIHIEKIEFDGKEDEREYGYFKLVYRDNFENIYYKEVPVFLDDNIETIFYRLNKGMRIINNCLVGNKIYIGNKDLNEKNVIFSQQATGYFIHEVIGHLLEEDIYSYSRRYLENARFDKKLTIIDDIKGHEKEIGLSNFDDMGVKIAPIHLMEQGKITDIISLQQNEYGVARAKNYQSKILPRMRCTYLKGHQNIGLEELKEEIDRVIVIENIYSGYCSFLTGDFTIGGDGYLCIQGENKYLVKNIIIKGNAVDYLNKIRIIGNDMKFFAVECGKWGEAIRVGIGGPSIVLSDVKMTGDLYEL